MDNKKFEKLIDLIINEDQERARDLFHEIVVEKSREIYESIMEEEMMEEAEDDLEESAHDDDDAVEESAHDDDDAVEEGMGHTQTTDLLDEIGADVESDESGLEEDEDEEIDIDAEMGDEEGMDSEGSPEERIDDLEDRIVDVEDELDALLAKFDMNDGGEEDADDMPDDEEEMDMSMSGEEDEQAMMENVQLKQVPGLYGSKIGGDDGANSKSVALTKPKVVATGANPVKFSGQSEAVPTSPKGPSNAYSKGETHVKGAGSFKNAPAQNNFKEKGESTPKPVTKDEAGKVKSPVAESKKVKKRI